jgi:hypothetical protein
MIVIDHTSQALTLRGGRGKIRELEMTGLLFWRGALRRTAVLSISMGVFSLRITKKRLKEMVSIISKKFSEKNFLLGVL